MPAGAFQYCEAMRTASSFGWYVYSPKDISLLFDGREIFFYEENQWFPLKSINFEDEFREHWRSQAPEELHGFDPPFMSELFVPGVMQIWSGYFVSTQPGWSLSVRSPVNYDIRSSLSVFEGIVESDTFKPWPLFINIRLLATDREIYISKDRPLFQMQPLPKSAYADSMHSLESFSDLKAGERSFDWDGVGKTVRKSINRDMRRPGTYAVETRKKEAQARIGSQEHAEQKDN